MVGVSRSTGRRPLLVLLLVFKLPVIPRTSRSLIDSLVTSSLSAVSVCFIGGLLPISLLGGLATFARLLRLVTQGSPSHHGLSCSRSSSQFSSCSALWVPLWPAWSATRQIRSFPCRGVAVGSSSTFVGLPTPGGRSLVLGLPAHTNLSPGAPLCSVGLLRNTT